MRFLLLLAVLLSGCEEHKAKWHVKCESPYYSGEADYASTSKEGTWIRTKTGERFDYPPSVKCEVHFTREHK